MAIFMPPDTNEILGTVTGEKPRTASSIAMTTRQLESSSGLAMAGTLFSGRREYLFKGFLHSALI